MGPPWKAFFPTCPRRGVSRTFASDECAAKPNEQRECRDADDSDFWDCMARKFYSKTPEKRPARVGIFGFCYIVNFSWVLPSALRDTSTLHRVPYSGLPEVTPKLPCMNQQPSLLLCSHPLSVAAALCLGRSLLSSSFVPHVTTFAIPVVKSSFSFHITEAGR